MVKISDELDQGNCVCVFVSFSFSPHPNLFFLKCPVPCCSSRFLPPWNIQQNHWILVTTTVAITIPAYVCVFACLPMCIRAYKRVSLRAER